LHRFSLITLFVGGLFLTVSWPALAPAEVVRVKDCAVDGEIFQLPQCAIETRHNQLYVSKPYLRLFVFEGPYKLAARVLPQGDWSYFNRKGRVVVRNVAPSDNGPSPFHYGLLRVVSGDKWGLANARGAIVVPLQYDGIVEFFDDMWKACVGCHVVKQGEHSWWDGGEWVRLDRYGKYVGETENPNVPAAAFFPCTSKF
jgi:hypothetical protein